MLHNAWTCGQSCAATRVQMVCSHTPASSAASQHVVQVVPPCRAHRRKLSRLAAALSDGPHILRLIRTPQPEASGAGQAAFMVCTALQAYCAAVQACGELADAIWEPSSSETLQQLLAPMAALLVGPCLDELEAASRAVGAGRGAATACATAANLQETLCRIAGLVLLTRCGSEAMAAAIVTPNPRRLAHFLFAVNSLLISPGWGQLAREDTLLWVCC